MAQQPPPSSILRVKQLVARLSISKSSIYERINPLNARYDASFPKPIKIGNVTAFLAHEVEEYLESKKVVRPLYIQSWPHNRPHPQE